MNSTSGVWSGPTNYVKDPQTGRRRSRANADDRLVQVDVAHLRIVPQELWDAVRARQVKLERANNSSAELKRPFWWQQRPRYLFSGLMRCGICGGGFSKAGASTFGCSTARNKGPAACTNRLSIRRDVLERTALDGLANRLMDPDLFKVFVSEFTAEWNDQQSPSLAIVPPDRRGLDRVGRQIERLVDALADGTPAVAVNGRLRELEQRRLALEAELAKSVAPAPQLHPNLAEIYREKIAGLTAALARNDAAEARDVVRSLVEAILLVPEDGRLRIEVRGELAAILALVSAGKASRAGDGGEPLAKQIKLVAGTGNHRQLTPLMAFC